MNGVLDNIIMNDNSTLRQQAISLRGKGKTFRQISRELNIPLGTIHLWTKNVQLTTKQLETIKKSHHNLLIAGRIKAAHKQKKETARQHLVDFKIGEDKVGHVFTQKDLLLIGAALYWGEGFKKDSRLGFANSDPQMIKLFLDWLIKIGNIPKTDIRLRVGVNQAYIKEIDVIQNEWSVTTGIPRTQFQKPFFQKTKHKKQYSSKIKYLGVLRIRVNKQVHFFHQILGMINALQHIAT